MASVPSNETNLPALSGLQPLSFARMLWKQWVLLLVTWAALSIAGIVVVMQLPTLYSAEAMILVESQKIPENLVASTVNAEIQDRLATIRQQILSSTRLQKVIDKFGLYSKEKAVMSREELIEAMRKDIKITLERGWTRNQPGAFRISYTGPGPEIVASVANELSSQFMEENMRTRENQAVGTSEFLDTQLQQAKKSLEEQEAKVAEYKRTHNGELPEQEHSLISVIDNMKVQLQALQEAVNRSQQSKTLLEQELGSAEAYVAATNRMLTEPAAPVVNSQGQVVSPGTPGAVAVKRSDVLRKELSDLLLRYKPEFPVVRETQALLTQVLKQEDEDARRMQREAAAQAQVSAKQTSSAPQPAAKTTGVRPEVAQILIREQSRVNTLKTQIQLIEKDVADKQLQHDQMVKAIGEYQVRLERLPLRQQEMSGLLRDYDISKDNYKSLLNKEFSAEMSSDMEKRQKAERFTILDPARVPEKPAKPNRPLLNGISVAVSLVFALIVSIGREWKQGYLLGDWELPEGTQVLGYVPSIVPRRTRAKAEPPAQASVVTAGPRMLRWGLISSLFLSVVVLVVIGLWLRRG